MNDPTRAPLTPAQRYADDAGRADDQLDARLSEIRNQEDAGSITVREAADMRIVVMETHLRELRELRIQHFGAASARIDGSVHDGDPEGTP